MNDYGPTISIYDLPCDRTAAGLHYSPCHGLIHAGQTFPGCACVHCDAAEE